MLQGAINRCRRYDMEIIDFQRALGQPVLRQEGLAVTVAIGREPGATSPSVSAGFALLPTA
jgi:hypothetical protein